MKILYYSSNPQLNLASPSGYGTHMREIIKGYRELGHEVSPFIAGGTEMSEELKPEHGGGIKKMVKLLTPPSMWETLKDRNLINFDRNLTEALSAAIEEYAPDIIYERGTYLQTSGVHAAKNNGIPLILELNAPLKEERILLGNQSLYNDKADRDEAFMLKHAHKIVVVSSTLIDHYTNKYGIDREKFILTPNAIDPLKLKVDKGEIMKLRQDLDIEGKQVIGFVGSIFKYHGVDSLIDAFAKVHTEFPESHLLIVGDGEVLPDLKGQAIRLGIKEKCTFTGNVPHQVVFNYISLFDIAVLPRTEEYMSPIKLFEYGAMGKAIISPDTQAVRDVIQDGEHGILIKTNKELVFALEKLIRDDQLRNKIATAFQSKVLKEHTWKKMAERIINAVS